MSSSLVAMGFLSSRKDVFLLFAGTVLPALFLLGPFTVVRLVETALESMHYLTGIARIRAPSMKEACEDGPSAWAPSATTCCHSRGIGRALARLREHRADLVDREGCGVHASRAVVCQKLSSATKNGGRDAR